MEEGDPGLVYLDVAGLRGLFGSEEQLAWRLVGAAAARGRRIRVGIGSSRISARIACCRGSGVTVVEPGREAGYLAPVPLSLLGLSEEMAARLDRWGIRTLGELAALPPAQLFERIGAEGVRLQRLARGEDSRPLQPWEPPRIFEESMELEWGVDTLGPLVDLVAKLAGVICDKLVRRGLSADEFEWACRLADRTSRGGSVAPAFPTNDSVAVATLLGGSLEARPPGGTVEAVTLRARPVRVAPAQQSLADRSRPSPRELAATLARLAALVGGQQIGVPMLLDSHRPDAVTLAAFPQGRGQGRESGEGRAALALRRLRPPLPASMTLVAGRPVELRSAQLSARVVISVGPWRASGEWWAERPWLHDEWDVELADGTVCRLAHDGSAWWLEGIYD